MIRKIGVISMALALCAAINTDAKTVLFIGDSVTDGGWGRSGGSSIPSEQRNQNDLNHIYGHSYMMLCASRMQAQLPYADLNFINRGISGNTLTDLEARWKDDVINLQPDVLSVLVGTNDAAEYLDSQDRAKQFDYDAWKQRYSSLLTAVREKNPGVKILLGTPFVSSVMSAERRAVTDSLAKHVRELAAEQNAICVPYDSLFRQLELRQPRKGYWIWDGIHPTAAGHEKMAQLLTGKMTVAGMPAEGGDNRITIPIDRARLAESPAGPFQPTWESLEENYRTPEWFEEAKFGIFIHWGPYAVAASGSEWYPRHMYNGMSKEHSDKWGKQNKFVYKDFIPLFKAEKFNPEEWAELFERSGAKYVIPTAEHHDGFAMYASELTEWNAAEKGPKRDIIGELATAVRGKGLKFGVSNHRVENWDFMYPSLPHDSTDLFQPEYASLYGPPQQPTDQSGMGPGKTGEGRHPQSDAFMDEWQLRVMEIIDRYQPDLLYFDNGINYRSMDPWKLAIARYYYNSAYNWGKAVSIQSKSRAYLAGSILDFERESRAPRHPYGRYWQVDDPIGHKFGYVEGLRLQSAEGIIRNLIMNVACGGNLCLNISPRTDGTIPADQQERLLKIGDWLQKYGEGIYGTKPYTTYGEGKSITGNQSDSEIRFTCKDDGSLYAFLLKADGKPFTIRTLAGKKIKRIINLANGKKVRFSAVSDGIRVDNHESNDAAIGFKIELH